MPKEENKTSRRKFLKNSAIAAIGVAVGVHAIGARALHSACSKKGKIENNDIIIDAHTHLFPPGMDKVGTAEMLIAEMDACGIGKAVIMGIYPRVHNEFIAEQTQSHPDRLIGLASVNPNDGQAALDLLDRCVREFGSKGVKIHPSMQHFRADDTELLTPLVSKIEALNIPVLMHSWAWPGQPDGNSAPTRIMNMAQKFPNVTFVMAHAGGMRFMDLLVLSRRKRLQRLNNLYVDLSSILFDVADSPMLPILSWTLARIGLDRVLMGSDFPDHPLAETLRITRSLKLDENGMKLVLGGNAARVYGA